MHLFKPDADREEAPAELTDKLGVQQPERIVLVDLPIGAVIQFHGRHWDSRYLCKIVNSPGNGKENFAKVA